ncbi:MAG TPA: di-heme-cytochrome C peroxidase [Allosphingosinicella sp.]|nr:di-heme-cytochrome C peroxidase [Allosphingosinicella sp.]
MKHFWTISAAAAAALLGGCDGADDANGNAGGNAVTAAGEGIWLEQGWSPADRAWYHHAGQGTSTFPVQFSWFLALEQPDNPNGLMRDPAYLDRFGFISSPTDAENNPHGLPVGFAGTPAINPRTGREIKQIGFTCAACHTGRIDYQGKQMLIDGGPGLVDLGAFRTELGKALLQTLKPENFRRFAARVLGPKARPDQLIALKLALADTVKKGLGEALAERLHGRGTLVEGFGRLDALNRIGNEVFAHQMGRIDNLRPLTAPVAYPHIWDTHWFDWVQYNGSIEQPMVRNAGEAMGVRAIVNYTDPATPPFTSTVRVDNLYEIERKLAGPVESNPAVDRQFKGLRPPAWPEDILPKIDRALAARGEILYRERCQGCHLPAMGTDAFWTGPHWLPGTPETGGHRYLRLTMVPVDKIGTDPAQAVDMKARTVKVDSRLGLPNRVGTAGRDNVYGFGRALGDLVERVVDRWYADAKPPKLDRALLNGYRPNGIRDGIGPSNATIPAYKARPLDGIWATAPFLHNGSVATLYDLLSPYEERNRVPVWLGNREFDPVKVGYVSVPGPRYFRVDTTRRGNWNTGHLFERKDPNRPVKGRIGDYLEPEQRRALVEYLKTL